MTYLFSVFSVPSVANIFFVPNAQLRPIVERRSFPAPRLPRRSSKSEGGSNQSRGALWTIECVYAVFVCAGLFFNF